MFSVSLDDIVSLVGFATFALFLLSVLSLPAALVLNRVFERNQVTKSPFLLTIRFLIAAVLVGLCAHLVMSTGSINCICEIQSESTITCQRQRKLVYGVFKQETVLNSLNAVKTYKRFYPPDGNNIELQLIDAGNHYLLYPAHQFSRLERVMNGTANLYSIDDALQDIRNFKMGDMEDVMHFRDRVGILEHLFTMFQVVALSPIVLFAWLMSEHFLGELGR